MSGPPKTIRTIARGRTPMPEQAPGERVRNFFEVALGYGMELAVREADRCLDCSDPRCLRGCPVAVDIPGFLRKVVSKDYRGAYDLLTRTNVLPAICGRVCPQEDQCEGVCTVGDALEPVAIGRVERWLGDLAIEQGWSTPLAAEPNGFRVGIVGSGPAGMACAADLARLGCDVTVYDALHAPGGVLRYGIPEFRLPKRVLDAEIEKLVQLGVKIECNTLVGRLFTIEQMIQELGFHAVFIATGAGLPKFMGIAGEGLNGVLSANELLTRCNLMQAGKFPEFDTPLGLGRRVAVIGAGNTAMDALRVSLRAGAERVACVYRRSRAECPGRAEELHHAEQEGVEFHWLTNPVAILDDGAGKVRGLRCVRMELGEPDESGRRRPEPLVGSEFELEADTVVYAIGTNANPIIGQTSQIALNRWGYLETDASLATSLAGVFAGGDIVTGSATVILAMGAGRRAARSIATYLGLSEPEPAGVQGVFGIEPGRGNFVRMRACGPSADTPASTTASELCPAALRPVREIERLRHAYPLVLRGTGAGEASPVQSLRALFDGVLSAASAPDPEELKRAALRLEAHIRARACDRSAGPEQPSLELRALAAEAQTTLLERTPSAARATAAERYQGLLAALPSGTLAPCGRRAAEDVLERLWQRESEQRERTLHAELDALEHELAVLARADQMTTHEAWSSASLARAVGDCQREDFDFEALSRLLTPRRASRPQEPPRLARIRKLQSGLGPARASLALRPQVSRSCAAALAALAGRARALADLLAAAEQAQLETRGEQSAHALSRAPSFSRADVLARLPSLLVLLDADRLSGGEQAALLALLTADWPVTILCTSASLTVDAALSAALPGGGGFVGGPAALLAAQARGLGNVRVLQTALSHLPHCLDELAHTLAASGPALIAVYTGEAHPSLPPFVAAAAARAARVFPSFRYDPIEMRLSLADNPSPEASWPRAPFRAENHAAQGVEHDEAFTAAHLFAANAELSAFAAPARVEPTEDTALVSVDVFLSTSEAAGAPAEPYVSMVDAQERLLRVIVSGPILEQTRRVAEQWRRLQQAARASAPHAAASTQPAVCEEQAAASAHRSEDPSGAQPDARVPERAPLAGKEPAAPAPAAASDGAWIETARCSSCDECIRRSPRMFAYDADKRAVLRDARAGTYRELVEAAEHCKMAIIHPGRPWDASEPDLEELRQRAAVFV